MVVRSGWVTRRSCRTSGMHRQEPSDFRRISQVDIVHKRERIPVRKSTVALYAPFIAIALVQALFIALFPSTGAGPQKVASGGLAGGPTQAADAFSGETGVPADTGPAGATPGASGTGGTGPAGSSVAGAANA